MAHPQSRWKWNSQFGLLWWQVSNLPRVPASWKLAATRGPSRLVWILRDGMGIPSALRRGLDEEKSGTSLGVTGAEPVQGSGADGRSCAASGCRRIVRGRTGFSPAHPFGSLATTGAHAEGPWLCVAVFRRVCPFEDERRVGSKRDAAACPRKPPLKPAEPFAFSTLGRNRGLRKRLAFAQTSDVGNTSEVCARAHPAHLTPLLASARVHIDRFAP